MSVRYEINDRVAVVTIDRPEVRNAIDNETARELFGTFARFESDEAADVAVLTGAGGTFCAGFDLRAFSEGQLQQLDPSLPGPMGPTRMVLSKPAIAAVEGYAVAGGMELALWCDLRVAASDATFGIFNRRFGVPLVDLGTIRLPRLIGHSVAMELILTGRPVTAVEAKQIGLVNRLAPKGEALNAASALAREIASFPQIALRNDRMSAIEQWFMSQREAMENEIRYGLATLASGEALDGAKKFLDGEGRHGEGSVS
jgi:enoyl-CoA hydratase